MPPKRKPSGQNSKLPFAKTFASKGSINDKFAVEKSLKRQKSEQPRSDNDLVNELESSSDSDASTERVVEPHLSKSKSKKVRFRLSGKESPSQIEDSEPWYTKYSPQTSAEVALHSKKKLEVRDALFSMSRDRSNKILILSGPPGASKTTIINVLSRSLNMVDDNGEVLSWTSPEKIEGTSLVESFGEFLNGAQFHQAEEFSRVVLVDDLPNLSHMDTRKMFNSALLEWINKPRTALIPPTLVLIVTEMEVSPDGDNYDYRNESVIVERIFLNSLLSDSRVKRIKFLPVNKTLINKTLGDIASQETSITSKIPKKDLTEAIKSLSGFGDIRQAIIAFEYWARWRADVKSTNVPAGRNTQVGLFHSVGKIIYGTNREKQKISLEDVGDAELDSVAVSDVLDTWGSDSMFNSVLFWNYPAARSSRLTPETRQLCSESFSISDQLRGMNQLVSEINCQSLRQSIRNSSDDPRERPMYQKLTYPGDRKIASQQLKSSKEHELYCLRSAEERGIYMLPSDSILQNGYYEPIIAKSRSTRRLWERRVGGVINTSSAVVADDEEYMGPLSSQPALTTVSAIFSDDDIDDSGSGF